MSLKITSVAFLLMSYFLITYGPNALPPEMITISRQTKVEPKIKTYGFVHHETTGISSYVIINGKEIPIRFRADSDSLAVKSLKALNWRIFLPNSDGTKLFLIGQYFAQPKRTSSCEQCPEAEEYREFKLLDWYITTPFKIVREDCNDCSYLLEENQQTRRKLELKDFLDFEGRDEIDVRRFQREKRIPTRRRI